MKILALILVVLMISVAETAIAAEGPGENPDQNQSGFLSDTISAAMGKLGQYSSGEKTLLSDDAKGADMSSGRDEFGMQTPPHTRRSRESLSDSE